MPEVTEPYPKGAMDLHMDVHVRATQGAVTVAVRICAVFKTLAKNGDSDSFCNKMFYLRATAVRVYDGQKIIISSYMLCSDLRSQNNF